MRVTKAFLGALTMCAVALLPGCVDREPPAGPKNALSQARLRAQLKQAAAAMKKAGSYHASVTVFTKTAKGPIDIKIESDVEFPDRVRSQTTVNGQIIESITVGGDTWVKDSQTGKWSSNVSPQPPKTYADPFIIVNSLRELRKGKSKVVDGVEVDTITAVTPLAKFLIAFPLEADLRQSGTASISIGIRKPDSVITEIHGQTKQPGEVRVDEIFSRVGERFGIERPAV